MLFRSAEGNMGSSFFVCLFFNLFIYLFLAALGLCCCVRTFSSCGERGLLFVVVCGLLIEVASHCGAWSLGTRASVVAERGLNSCGSRTLERRLSSCGAWLSCSAACGIFPDQGSNSCPLHWQADS